MDEEERPTRADHPNAAGNDRSAAVINSSSCRLSASASTRERERVGSVCVGGVGGWGGGGGLRWLQ